MLRTFALCLLIAGSACSNKTESAPVSTAPTGAAPSGSAASPAPAPIKPSKNPDAAKALMAEGAVVIDVRPASEYAQDHLQTAVNIPVSELPARLAEVEQLVGADKTRPIVVYCMAGGMASKAKRALEAAGYSKVENGGGIDDLR
ncbi:MAG: rhodanese-like domain-containing protein [Kofleriaceae bacterium]